MGPFIQRHEENVTGVLSGFDRGVRLAVLRWRLLRPGKPP